MDKNFKHKFKDLFRKESFYIALFLCLCIMAAVGTVSYKRLNSQKELTKVQEAEKEITLNINDKSVTNEIPNAERVEKSADNSQLNKTTATKDNSKSVASTTKTVKLSNPLDGTISREYTYPKPVKVEDNIYRSIRGINLTAKVGTQVKAASDGVVETVGNAGVEEGIVVEIKHANGLKTRYGNLDQDVSVKTGEKVSANQVIGKVGETAKLFDAEKFGEYLNLQVINAKGEQVNPEQYFSLKTN
ncbi:peptidoglycan DD-metalloendopeptidase family protein [Clostridium uliginosum]|uniref:Peptidase family M23 n=1 Tax=Clostridium uliginosum TaxID=119641 RepID=A0A1I1I9P9_9CLOT|nr:peptidoglycan DD-metalloendopeptidase family protein [Clostridium uliginosum]SFC32755.1 Peptidase family M23 [Clostridium uliginosum]